jgi:hypothetical protein
VVADVVRCREGQSAKAGDKRALGGSTGGRHRRTLSDRPVAVRAVGFALDES